jgi:transcriptional regulator with XRE-family HTH domain
MVKKMEIGERIALLRDKKGWKQKDLADKVNLNVSVMNRIEKGTRPLNDSEIIKIAAALEVSTEYLLTGRTGSKLPELTEKDERDIARDLEKMLNDLESKEALSFHGEPMDEETKEALRLSLESSLRFAKQLAKQKFTPKKHRNDKDN